MTDLTELEQQADREARHGHRELVKRLEEENRELALQVLASQGQADEALGRVAELKAERDAAWNAAIRAAASLVHGAQWEGIDEPNDPTGRSHNSACRGFAEAIRTLLRNEGGSDE